VGLLRFLVLIFLISLPLFFCPIVFAQDITERLVEGQASMENLTKEDARRLAIEDALRKAVEEVVGVDVLASTLVVNFRQLGDIIRVIPYGRVVEREVLEEGVKEIRQKGKTTPSLIYWVKVKSKVQKEKGGIDPFFKLAEAALNREVFKDGDQMVIKVKPTKDCYLTIFNILQDEKVLILVPSRFKKNNFVKADETFAFPDDDDFRKGIKLVVHGSEGKKSVETIYILGLKQPLKFPEKFQEGLFGTYRGQTAFMTDLIKEIVEIPLSERAEKFLQYQVTR